MSEDEMAIVALVVIAGIMLLKKPASSATGVSSITGGGPLLNCCDANGNIVDAGSSMYCPPGSQVC